MSSAQAASPLWGDHTRQHCQPLLLYPLPPNLPELVQDDGRTRPVKTAILTVSRQQVWPNPGCGSCGFLTSALQNTTAPIPYRLLRTFFGPFPLFILQVPGQRMRELIQGGSRPTASWVQWVSRASRILSHTTHSPGLCGGLPHFYWILTPHLHLLYDTLIEFP